MFHALQIVTTVIVGVMVGVEFSVPVFSNPVMNALPDDANLAGRAHGGRVGGAVMPAWYIASLALTAVWAVAGWGEDGSGAGAAAVAGALLALSVVLSVTVLVPINNRVKRWTVAERPADWKQQLLRWDRFHYLRVAVIVAAFALQAVALSA